ncbi:MAG TPA: SCE4755 family polysaccharide monooxygenase-like protein, partial [Kofleriaceae bacterium]|nr:SCE4755 family polysaccharide monooxygenase-like protein [Kofleriaceae bacterium]
MSRTSTLATCVAVLGLAATAEAHFKLNDPAALSQQSSLGDPQKSGPCGQADPGNPLVPTNMVTAVQSGTMLTISINETVFHPGHYRVALAQDMNSLPADPPVTAGSTACGSTVIDPNPTMPLLGDGLLQHTTSFGNAPKTMQVPIPAGLTCTNCVLQVTQFMSNHGLNNPGGCFYHHCATVSISPDAPPPTGDAGTTEPGTGTGCCSASPDAALTGLLGSLAVGLLALRRR